MFWNLVPGERGEGRASSDNAMALPEGKDKWRVSGVNPLDLSKSKDPLVLPKGRGEGRVSGENP